MKYSSVYSSVVPGNLGTQEWSGVKVSPHGPEMTHDGQVMGDGTAVEEGWEPG